MKYKSIADLPVSASSLTLIQKAKALKVVNELIEKGHEPEASVLAVVDQLKRVGTDLAVKSVGINKASDSGEEMISYEIIYEPNTPDTHGQWMSPETLVKAQADFTAAQATGAVTENLFHLYDTDAFSIESTWIQPELDVLVQSTGEVIKAGSWVAKVKYKDAGLWELKKANVVGGLSIQCGGGLIEETGELVNLNFGIELEGDKE